jgi:hypothetical protein
MTFVKNKLNNILFVLIAEFLLFIVSGIFLQFTNYAFRGWVTNLNILVFLVIFCLFALKFIISLVHFMSNWNDSGKYFYGFVLFGITFFLIFVILSQIVPFCVFSYTDERDVIKNNEIMVARILMTSFHHPEVEFFYPDNYLLLKKSGLPIEKSNNSLHYYEHN